MPVNKDSASYNRARKNFAKEIDKKIQAIQNAVGTTTTQRMEKAVDVLAKEALELTPRDTGNLQSSQYQGVKQEGTKIIGFVGYDTDKAPYALLVHQLPKSQGGAPSDRHNRNPPRAQFFFLGAAVQNKSKEIIDILNGMNKKMKKDFEK